MRIFFGSSKEKKIVVVPIRQRIDKKKKKIRNHFASAKHFISHERPRQIYS